MVLRDVGYERDRAILEDTYCGTETEGKKSVKDDDDREL